MGKDFEQKNSDMIWLEAKITHTPDEKGKLIHFNGTATDVTEKHKVKEELDANIEKYMNIIENINGALYIINEQGLITFISKSIQNVFGYRPDEVIGKNYLEFILEEDIQIAKKGFASSSLEKNSLSEYHIKTKEGRPKLVNCINKAVFNKSEFAGIMGVLIDVSEGKNEEKSLEFQTQLLKNVGEGAIAINLIIDGSF